MEGTTVNINKIAAAVQDADIILRDTIIEILDITDTSVETASEDAVLHKLFILYKVQNDWNRSWGLQHLTKLFDWNFKGDPSEDNFKLIARQLLHPTIESCLEERGQPGNISGAM